jgi:hypothetical protein
MKKIFTLIAAVCLSAVATAQTLNVVVGQVTYQVPAAQAGDMIYTSGTSVTIMNKVLAISDIDNMYIDNTAVTDNSVSVVYNGTAASVYVAGNIMQYVDPTVNGAKVTILQNPAVTDEYTYTLSGSSTVGSFYMDGDTKMTLRLNGLTLTNPDSAAVNIRDGKRIAVVVADGTTNTLTDGTGGSQKACFAVKGHAEFTGAGTLNLKGNTACAYWGKEYLQLKASFTGALNVTGSVGDGINVNQYYQQNGGKVTISGVGDDGIQVSFKTDDSGNVIAVTEDEDNTGEFLFKGGTLTVTNTAAGSKGVKAEGPVTINQTKGTSTITITTSGGVDTSDSTDPTSSSCMNSDNLITIQAGTINLTNSGQGGRALTCDKIIDVQGGVLTAKATGSNYGSSSTGPGGGGPGGGGWPGGGGQTSSNAKNAKGVKAKTGLTISGGTVTVSSAYHEGMESKGTMTLSGGTIKVTASDDAINSSSDMTISDSAKVYSYSSSNDGLDSNGNMYIKGGVAVAFGAGGAETGIDISESCKLYITGGEIFGIGGRVDASTGTCTQAHGNTSSSCSSSGYFVLSDSSNNRIFAVKIPTSSYSGIVFCSSASMTSGSKYTIGSATSVTGTNVNGFVASPTVSSVSSTQSFTASK